MFEILVCIWAILISSFVDGISVRSYNRNFDFSSSTPSTPNTIFPPHQSASLQYNKYPIHRTSQTTSFSQGNTFQQPQKPVYNPPIAPHFTTPAPSFGNVLKPFTKPVHSSVPLQDKFSLGGLIGSAFTSADAGFKEVRPGVYAKTVASSRNKNLIVHKNVFLHVGPGYVPPPQVPRKVKKHYKLVFIKTPHTPSQKVILPPPQIPEEKTIVYVLSEAPKKLKVPALKINHDNGRVDPPEVFLIKYDKDEDFKTLRSGNNAKSSNPLTTNQVYRKRSSGISSE